LRHSILPHARRPRFRRASTRFYRTRVNTRTSVPKQ
jgi:hypothetical protein